MSAKYNSYIHENKAHIKEIKTDTTGNNHSNLTQLTWQHTTTITTTTTTQPFFPSKLGQAKDEHICISVSQAKYRSQIA